MDIDAVRVFISHSANEAEEPATQRFLDKLVKAIGKLAGFAALTDQKDLAAGDVWLQQLYAWMGICDAAVILLSPRAVTRENSGWVPRETNLLMWRKALDPGFLVIPVLLGGVTQDDIENNPLMRGILLDQIQLAKGATDAARIGQVVGILRSRLAGATRARTFDPVYASVEDALARHTSERFVKETLRLHYSAPTWAPGADPVRDLALQMIRQAATPAVDEAIGSVAAGSQTHIKLGAMLFATLYPMRLPAEPACRLLSLCLQHEGSGAVLVNANDTWVVKMLLQAASGLPGNHLRSWRLVEMQNDWGDDDLAEMTVRLAEELAEKVLGTGGWDSLGNHADPLLRQQEQIAALRELLEESRSQCGSPIVVCAPYTPRWSELVGTLSALFPAVVFLFWSGDALPPLEAVAANCTPLEPSWPGGADRQWQLRHRMKLVYFNGPPT